MLIYSNRTVNLDATVHTIGSLHGTRFAHTIESQRNAVKLVPCIWTQQCWTQLAVDAQLLGSLLATHVESGPKSAISPVGGAEMKHIFAVTGFNRI